MSALSKITNTLPKPVLYGLPAVLAVLILAFTMFSSGTPKKTDAAQRHVVNEHANTPTTAVHDDKANNASIDKSHGGQSEAVDDVSKTDSPTHTSAELFPPGSSRVVSVEELRKLNPKTITVQADGSVHVVSH